MSCEAVRTALIDGTSVEVHQRHIETCVACGALVALRPGRVDLAPPPVEVRDLHERSRAQIGHRVVFAAGLLTALGGGLAIAQAAGARTDDEASRQLGARSALHAAAGDPLAPDPLRGFADPTDLLAEALLGTGDL